jgi:tetratricopeptide (TPR) repeat protein
MSVRLAAKSEVCAVSNNPLELLKSANPTDRKKGIKLVAQMGNEKALRVLMKIYKEDEDPEVSAYAKKGAEFVAKKIREAESEPEPEPAPPPPPAKPEPAADDDDDEEEGEATEVEVSNADMKRAQGYMDEALSHQMNGDREKAITALAKALRYNPNLERDPYFNNIAGAAVGVGALEAINILKNEEKRKSAIDADRKQKSSTSSYEHLNTAQSHTWGKSAIDIVLLGIILFVGPLLMIMVADYSATTKAETLAFQINNQGRVDDEGEPLADPIAEEKLPRQIMAQQTAQAFSEAFSTGIGAMLGITTVLTVLPALLIFGLVTHPVAQRLMNGNGTSGYLIHNLLSAYTSPTLIIFVLLAVIMILTFNVGIPVPIGFAIMGGIVGLGTLVISLRAIGGIAKTYEMSFVKAFITAIIANIPASIVQGIVIGIGSAVLGAFVASISGMLS